MADTRRIERSDADLLASASGNPDALDPLVRRHREWAVGLAYRILGDLHAAEDAVQQAFLSLLLSAHGYDPSRSFRAYFATCVRNAARIQARSCASRRDREDDAATLAPVSHEPDPSQTLIEAELHRAVAGLPEDLRLPIELCYYDHLTHVEAAAVLDMPAGTISTRLRQAWDFLREALGAFALTPVLLERLLGALGDPDLSAFGDPGPGDGGIGEPQADTSTGDRTRGLQAIHVMLFLIGLVMAGPALDLVPVVRDPRTHASKRGVDRVNPSAAQDEDLIWLDWPLPA